MPKRRIVDIEAAHKEALEAKDAERDNILTTLGEIGEDRDNLKEENEFLRNILTASQKNRIAELGRSFESEGESDGED